MGWIMKKIRKIIFMLIYMIISTWLFSFWLFDNRYGIIKQDIVSIIIFVLLMAANIIFVIMYFRKKIKNSFKVTFVAVILISF